MMIFPFDDYDEAEFWRWKREQSKKKRAANIKHSTWVLAKEGISFVSKNDGIHLIVEDRIDFWPSTGLFICRKTGFRHRGIKNLLKYLETP